MESAALSCIFIGIAPGSSKSTFTTAFSGLVQNIFISEFPRISTNHISG
jgi:hypothetical protein